MFQSLKQRLGFDTKTIGQDQIPTIQNPDYSKCTSLACEHLVRELRRHENRPKPFWFYHKLPSVVQKNDEDIRDDWEEIITESVAIRATKEASDAINVQLNCQKYHSNGQDSFTVSGMIQ